MTSAPVPTLSALGERLTGRIALYLDPREGAAPRLVNERPDFVQALSQGKPASALPGLLSALFSVCGHAQRLTAERAVQAALGVVTPLNEADARLLQAETLREHLRRLWLDWPRCLLGAPGLGDAALQTLATCPAMKPGPATWALPGAPEADALRAWLAAHVFGQDPLSWLLAWQADGEQALATWAARTHTTPALLMRAAQAVAQSLCQAARPLVLTEGPAMRALVAALATQPGLARAPLWDGAAAETGPWCRQHEAHTLTGPLSLWSRMGGRLADLARLALPDGQGLNSEDRVPGPTGRQVLQAGALSLGGQGRVSEGLAWTEMARGTLLHWVRLDHRQQAEGQPTVSACQVIAPTEWHFHEQGPVASVLAQDARQHSGQDPRADLAQTRRLASLLAAVYDPCVPLVVLGGQPLSPMPNLPLAPRPDLALQESPCTN
jgi:hypothetical protein